MKVKEFLALLEEPVIESKLKEIIMKYVNFNCNDMDKQSTDDREVCLLKSEIESLQKELQIKDSQLEEQKNEFQLIYTRAQDRIEALEKEYTNLEQINVGYKKCFVELTHNCDALSKELASIKEDVYVKTNKIAELEELNRLQQKKLQESFADGWELYEKYNNLNEETKQLLSSVLPRENFSSFIVGMAKDSALASLWDETYRCVRNERLTDAEILWNIFRYAIYLVNQSKTEDVYVIDSTEIGDTYDVEYHRLTKRSRAHGNITKLVLLGFKNTYSDTIVRKSIVQI